MLIRTGQLLSARALVKTREILSSGRYFNPGMLWQLYRSRAEYADLPG
jgi:hypothetical protein